MDSTYSSVLVRYGEIGIKSKQTRKRMTRLLANSIKFALKGNSIQFDKVRSEYGRIFIETADADQAAEVSSRVFGVVSTSPVVATKANLEQILDIGLSLARNHFKKGLAFAVRARRFGEHQFSSKDVKEKLGAHILKELSDMELKVNLDAPDQIVYVEIRDDKAYLFTNTIDGVGGMPTGSQGKVVCTISSGLDSPIAAYKVMKRGCIPVFVNFDNSPHSDAACSDIAIQQATKLAEYIHGFDVKMYVVPHGPDLDDILKNAPTKMTCVFCKRNMLRLAREIAVLEEADAIVTGEIIGEQASQTSQNLRAINTAVCDYPILRPCAGDDKVDIEHLARQIGTYKFTREAVSCCTLPPKYPSVGARLEDIQVAEKEMNLDLIREEISQARIIILRTAKG